jgi:hypothetical protein
MKYIVTLVALALSAAGAGCASATPPAALASFVLPAGTLRSHLPASVTPILLLNDTDKLIFVRPAGAEKCMKKSVPRKTLVPGEWWQGDLETTADCQYSPTFDIEFSSEVPGDVASGRFYERDSEWTYDPRPTISNIRVRVRFPYGHVSAVIH